MSEQRIRQLERRSRMLRDALNKERADSVEWIIKSAIAQYNWAWRRMNSLPKNGQVLAAAADGRIMIWDVNILRTAMTPGTPGHLQFPAVAWMPKPNAPTRKTLEQCQVQAKRANHDLQIPEGENRE